MRKTEEAKEAPDMVWLAYTPGAYLMPRTSHKAPDAVGYVRKDAHDEAIEYINRMVGGVETDPVSVLVELRFALGDNGKRMFPELIDYAKEIYADAMKFRSGANA